MPFISVTRLRVRSLRFLPAFLWQTMGTIRQVKRAPGFRGGALLNDRRWAFWTMTAWDSADAMRAYMTTGAHRTAMPRLLDWCDEAALAHWDQSDAALPSWPDAYKRLRDSGRVSKVRWPSPDHAAMTYAAPRTAATATIRPVGAS